VPAILLDHIAIAIERLDDAPGVLADQLGGVYAYGGGRTSFYQFKQWRFAGGGRIEVLAPSGPDGFLHRFLDDRGPGLHHVTFKVPSLDETCARAGEHGYDIVGRDDSDPSWKEAFLHPKQALGIVVQLAEAAGDEPGAERYAPDPAGAVAIAGLRLRARSRERAHTQWGLVLGGAESTDASSSALIYRWLDSPLRLAVEIDPAGEEGPIAIDCRAARALPFPPAPHPVLGAVFRHVE
jgi:Glyoxalase/Bleomycin resistance protein/Dioxygenase superfamily